MAARRSISSLFLAVFLLISAAPKLPAQAAEELSLSRHLFDLAAHHAGSVSYFAQNLRSGQSAGFGADVPVKTASVIKLAILLHVASQIHSGQATLEDRLTLSAADQVGGSGVLVLLHPHLTLTVADALTLMTVLSDNTATNMLLERFPIVEVNGTLAAMGFSQTRLLKKVLLDVDPARDQVSAAEADTWGIGRSTAREAAMLMERLATCRFATDSSQPTAADGPLCARLLEMLRHQQDRNSLPRYLIPANHPEAASAIANKTGSLDDVRNDVALVATPAGPIVMAGFTWQNADTRWTGDNLAEQLLGRLAQATLRRWSPEGLKDAAFPWANPLFDPSAQSAARQ